MFLDLNLPDCIVEALGNPQKERLKHEDTNISDWLQGTSTKHWVGYKPPPPPTPNGFCEFSCQKEKNQHGTGERGGRSTNFCHNYGYSKGCPS